MFNLRLIGLFLLGILLAGAGGYYYGSGKKDIQIQEKVVYKEGETKVEYRDRTVIKERITKPDGTVVEKETVKDIDKSTDTKSAEVAKENRRVVTAKETNYSLGLQFSVDYKHLIDPTEYKSVENYEVIGGYRVLGPAWIELGGNLNHVTLGVRVEL